MVTIVGSCAIVDDRLRDPLIRFFQRNRLFYCADTHALLSPVSQRNNNDLKYLLQVENDNDNIGQYGLVCG